MAYSFDGLDSVPHLVDSIEGLWHGFQLPESGNAVRDTKPPFMQRCVYMDLKPLSRMRQHDIPPLLYPCSTYWNRWIIRGGSVETQKDRQSTNMHLAGGPVVNMDNHWFDLCNQPHTTTTLAPWCTETNPNHRKHV